eukprot:jgi/Mesvir1/17818/Mv12914-RA.2
MRATYDCWMEARRPDGSIAASATKFPSGMAALAEYVHARGLRFGLYTDTGNHTCEGFPGSWGHEEVDARTYAAWGVDYVKVDYCDMGGTDMPARDVYAHMGRALAMAGRSMVFSICNWGTEQPHLWGAEVGASSWRVGIDLFAAWDEGDARQRLALPPFLQSVTGAVRDMERADEQQRQQKAQRQHDQGKESGKETEKGKEQQQRSSSSPHKDGARSEGDAAGSVNVDGNHGNSRGGGSDGASSGHRGFNDPDMLLVGLDGMTPYGIIPQGGMCPPHVAGCVPGMYITRQQWGVVGGLSFTEQKAQFSLWCMLAAPLILGNDPRSMSDSTRRILLAKDVIAINQDLLGLQARKTWSDDATGVQVWVKELADGSAAVLALNAAPPPGVVAQDVGVEFARDLPPRLLSRTRAVLPAETCRDTDANCPGWARAGECDANPGFMRGACRKSCPGVCAEPPRVPMVFARCRDVWEQRELGAFHGRFTARNVEPHGVMLLVVTPLEAGLESLHLPPPEMHAVSPNTAGAGKEAAGRHPHDLLVVSARPAQAWEVRPDATAMGAILRDEFYPGLKPVAPVDLPPVMVQASLHPGLSSDDSQGGDISGPGAQPTGVVDGNGATQAVLSSGKRMTDCSTLNDNVGIAPQQVAARAFVPDVSPWIMAATFLVGMLLGYCVHCCRPFPTSFPRHKRQRPDAGRKGI